MLTFTPHPDDGGACTWMQFGLIHAMAPNRRHPTTTPTAMAAGAVAPRGVVVAGAVVAGVVAVGDK